MTFKKASSLPRLSDSAKQSLTSVWKPLATGNHTPIFPLSPVNGLFLVYTELLSSVKRGPPHTAYSPRIHRQPASTEYITPIILLCCASHHPAICPCRRGRPDALAEGWGRGADNGHRARAHRQAKWPYQTGSGGGGGKNPQIYRRYLLIRPFVDGRTPCLASTACDTPSAGPALPPSGDGASSGGGIRFWRPYGWQQTTNGSCHGGNMAAGPRAPPKAWGFIFFCLYTILRPARHLSREDTAHLGPYDLYADNSPADIYPHSDALRPLAARCPPFCLTLQRPLGAKRPPSCPHRLNWRQGRRHKRRHK